MYLIVNIKDNSIFTGVFPTGRYKTEAFKKENTILLCPIFFNKVEAEATVNEISRHFIGAELKALPVQEVEAIFETIAKKG